MPVVKKGGSGSNQEETFDEEVVLVVDGELVLEQELFPEFGIGKKIV